MFNKKKQRYCPFIKDECIGDGCMQYFIISGQDPVSGEDFRKDGCAMAWQPMLQLESSKEIRSVYSIIESQRNELCAQTEAVKNELHKLNQKYDLLLHNATRIGNR